MALFWPGVHQRRLNQADHGCYRQPGSRNQVWRHGSRGRNDRDPDHYSRRYSQPLYTRWTDGECGKGMSIATRPDVILVHCHDLGTWLSCYGMPSVPSPNLARFATESIVFNNAYSTAPLCSPARSSLFTALSPHANGVQGLAHHGWRYRADVRTMPELLSEAGYHSVLVGLQHEHANPAVIGFDELAGVGFLPRALPVAGAVEEYLCERERRSSGQPLLMVAGMWEVHRPWPAEDYNPADPDSVDVPAYLPDNEETRSDIAAFHGSIRQMDEAMGRLIRAVDRHTDPDNTLLIFTTDHGAAFPRAKGTLYDPGVHVAFIVRPPRQWAMEPGRRGALVSHLDVIPTLLEAAGQKVPSRLEGISLRSVLAKDLPADEDARALFFEKTYHDDYDPLRAVRTRRHKLVVNFLPGTAMPISKDLAESATFRGMNDADFPLRPEEELYDLDTDPLERLNLAGDPDAADVRRDLRGRLDAWMQATGDPLLRGPISTPPTQNRHQDALPALEQGIARANQASPLRSRKDAP
jgi:arylsulfatase A-like enzyme